MAAQAVWVPHKYWKAREPSAAMWLKSATALIKGMRGEIEVWNDVWDKGGITQGEPEWRQCDLSELLGFIVKTQGRHLNAIWMKDTN